MLPVNTHALSRIYIRHLGVANIRPANAHVLGLRGPNSYSDAADHISTFVFYFQRRKNTASLRQRHQLFAFRDHT
eukprot:scaffold139213_cov19-Prasinocladus_malaysianus.AAC.1